MALSIAGSKSLSSSLHFLRFLVISVISAYCSGVSSEPLNQNEEEIAGYRDALNLIHNHYDELSP